eukprot:TRINITY_DN27384_c0_g1_i1.p1 TRINITY_DN27384_c0_g1~~TRINITY_DN27384_c0_g1_i1.p1  ORF type:complete len:113 (+),score=47.19 TRINITY_DN27384_c0_g1_i1:92-430(+)
MCIRDSPELYTELAAVGTKTSSAALVLSAISPSLHQTLHQNVCGLLPDFFEQLAHPEAQAQVVEGVATAVEAMTSPAMEQVIKLLPVSYTHLRAHETPEHLVCRLLLEKKKK